MFRRHCLLCLILSCRFVLGRLPTDVSPVNSFEKPDGLLSAGFSGVHNIEYVHSSFYVLSKNNISSVRIDASDDGGGEYIIEQVINWEPTNSEVINCKRKISDPTACDNYIRIFASKSSGKQFLVCGTNSFNPTCRTYRKNGNMFKEDSTMPELSGTSICPYNPKQTGVSLYTGGDLYAATLEDLLARKPVISRSKVDSNNKNLKMTRKDERSLNNPWFVKFVETTPKVYIFFKETAVEEESGMTYTRVGQLCKGEAGGERVLNDQFTSFAKARLNCSYPGDPPFYFNEIAAATDFYQMPGNPTQSILFAAMNTPKNSIWGSAVCAYVDHDIEEAMRGPFLERHAGNNGMHYWLEKESNSAVTNAMSE